MVTHMPAGTAIILVDTEAYAFVPAPRGPLGTFRHALACMAECFPGAYMAALAAVVAVGLEICADPVIAVIVSLGAESAALVIITDLVILAAVCAGPPAGASGADILAAAGAVDLISAAGVADAVLAPLVREADIGTVPAVHGIVKPQVHADKPSPDLAPRAIAREEGAPVLAHTVYAYLASPAVIATASAVERIGGYIHTCPGTPFRADPCSYRARIVARAISTVLVCLTGVPAPAAVVRIGPRVFAGPAAVLVSGRTRGHAPAGEDRSGQQAFITRRARGAGLAFAVFRRTELDAYSVSPGAVSRQAPAGIMKGGIRVVRAGLVLSACIPAGMAVQHIDRHAGIAGRAPAVFTGGAVLHAHALHAMRAGTAGIPALPAVLVIRVKIGVDDRPVGIRAGIRTASEYTTTMLPAPVPASAAVVLVGLQVCVRR